MTQPSIRDIYHRLLKLHPTWHDTQFADVLGVSREYIRQLRNELELPTADERIRQQVIDYLNTGEYGSDYDTAARFGVSYYFVHPLRIELGLPAHNRRMGPKKSEKRLQIEAYLKQETYINDYDTAARFGVLWAYIAQVRYALGLPQHGTQYVDQQSIADYLQNEPYTSDYQVAEALGVNRVAVWRVRTKLGLPSHGKRGPKPKREIDT